MPDDVDFGLAQTRVKVTMSRATFEQFCKFGQAHVENKSKTIAVTVEVEDIAK